MAEMILTTGPNDQYRPGGWTPRYVAIITVLLLLAELSWLQFAYPLSAMPQIGAEFQTSQIVWIGSIYLLVAALVSPITGTLADRYGKRRFLAFGLMLAFIGLIISAFAPNFGVLLLGRVLQAPVLTFPFLLPSISRDIFPTKIIPMAGALAATGAGLIAVPSLIVLGPIIEHLGWRATFWIPAILAVSLLVLLFAVVPESGVRQKTGHVDFLGTILLGGGVALLLVGVSFGPLWGWTSAWVLGGFVVGAVFLITWVFQATHIKYPLLDLHELTRAPILLTILFAAIAGSISGWLLTILPTIALTPTAQGGLGLDPDRQTQLTAVYTLGAGLAGFIIGAALRKRSGGPVGVAAVSLSTAGFVLAYFGLGSVPLFALAAFLIGIGSSGGLATGYMLMIRLVQKERQAAMSATLSLTQNLIAASASVVFFSIVNSFATPTLGAETLTYNHKAFTVAMIAPMILGVIGVAIAVALRQNLRGRDAPQYQQANAVQPTPESQMVGLVDQ